MTRILIVDSIGKINENEWDRLVDSEVFMNYGWLKTLEETYIQDIHHRYFLLFENEKLVGATYGCVSKRSKTDTDVDNYLFGRFKPLSGKLKLSFLPALLCGPVFSIGDHFLFDRTAHSRKRDLIAEKLLFALENEAERLGLPLAFSHLKMTERNLVNLLQQRNYRYTRMISEYQLDIPWTSFEGYLAFIKCRSKNMARHIRRELKINTREKVEIRRVNDPAPYEDRFYFLVDAVYRKHSGYPFCFQRNFFTKLKENVGKDVYFYIAEKGGVVTGFSAVFKKGESACIQLVAVDQDKAKHDHTYFNLGFYRPIEDATGDGIKRLQFGLGTDQLKIKRGCSRNDLFIYYRSRIPICRLLLKPWFAIVSAFYENQIMAETEKLPMSSGIIAILTNWIFKIIKKRNK